MLIGELSKKAGLSKDTIRFYEKIGLIAANDRQSGKNNYKDYDDETLERLLIIRQTKALGFTLNEIKEVIDDWWNGKIPQSEKLEIIQQKIEQVDEKIQQLYEIRTYLIAKLDKLSQSGP